MNARPCRPGCRAGAALALLLLTSTTARAQVQWVAEAPVLSPPARQDAVFISCANEDASAILCGGLGASGTPHGDTWRWDGANWVRLAPRTSPSARSEAAGTAVPDSGLATIFGGLDASGRMLSDLWSFDGDDWSLVEVGTSGSPPARAGHTMTHDRARNICIVFGGRDDRGDALDDTWMFDGDRWTVGDPQLRPPARWGHSAIWDPTLGGIIVVGGRDGRGDVLDDMWCFDGERWFQMGGVDVRPPARTEAALTWSDALGVALLFGGEDGRGGFFGDTWIWSGTAWTIAAFGDANERPSPRSRVAFGYDTLDRQILFGGEAPGAALALRSDTWSMPACGAGTVKKGDGAPASVLTANGSPGAPGSHEVVVALNASVEFRLVAAPSGPASPRYALLFWLGRASNPTPLVGPGGAVFGCTVNPTPLRRLESPQPFRCLRGAGIPSAFCGTVTELLAPPRAPFMLRKSSGFGSPIVMTVQGLIEDAGAANPTGFSVTNAVVLVVR